MFTVTVPSDKPKHDTSVCDVVTLSADAGCVSTNVSKFAQFKASVTVSK